MSLVVTSSENYTAFYENGEQVYPCRCGETHRGNYAIYDHGHHNCFHSMPLVDIGRPAVVGYLMCPQCGEVFWTEEGAAEVGSPEQTEAAAVGSLDPQVHNEENA